nr:hypothetical protein [sulfur-oxidizing endosymbiont of Gigantopelta aegis]
MKSAIRPSLSLPQVYLYLKPVDFRKSFIGLSAIVECELGHNPLQAICMPLPIVSVIKLNASSGIIPVLYSITKVSQKKSSNGQRVKMT